MKMFLFKECFSLEQIDSTKLGSHLYMNQEMAETWTLNVVCSLKARLDMIYSSDRFIPLIHWYVSAAVYWYSHDSHLVISIVLLLTVFI